MRILALDNKELNTHQVIEVSNAQYDEDCDGIYFFQTDGDEFYIPNVSITDCNWICRELFLNGFCDVTRFGEIH